MDECCSVSECLISLAVMDVMDLLTDLPPWLEETLRFFSACRGRKTAVSRNSSVGFHAENICKVMTDPIMTLYDKTNSPFLSVQPVFVHQHVADATADVVLSLSDFLQHQHPLGLLSSLLLADALLQTLLLLHITHITHTNVAEINTKQTAFKT